VLCFVCVLLKVHFGDTRYSVTGDSLFDPVKVTRLPVEVNSDMLLKSRDCFRNDGACNESRKYDIIYPVAGFSSLLSRLNLYITEMSMMRSWPNITPDWDYVLTSTNLCHHDLYDGLFMVFILSIFVKRI
jgi:hypothetical protein